MSLRTLGFRSVAAVLAGLLVATVAVAIAAARMSPPSGSTNLPDSGSVGDTLGTPDGLAITVSAVEHGSTRWLVHVHVHNGGNRAAVVTGTAHDHQFVLAGDVPRGTPYNQSFLQLGSPSAQEQSTHATLPASANANGDSDGWLAADLSAFPYPVAPEIAYRYDTFPSKECTTPTNQSTCHPVDLYRVIVWWWL